MVGKRVVYVEESMCLGERERSGASGEEYYYCHVHNCAMLYQLKLIESMFVNIILEREINVQVPKVELCLLNFVYLP